ncbi:hypothetical protein [Sediminicola arcticus]|jgi:hypothetical protein|uniref:Uncharacterized protein n=1 Tax=Sediminicola arcticus TaxID=1574308 RepID=A0ABV2STQ3_9FLAO|tara:strand:- start:51 stop:245 length:195 start_codon:yes stop_codon:yes gene_type:complete
MENQYCRVGSTTPITQSSDAISFLEYQYAVFMEKALQIKNSDAKLGEFFEGKASKIKKMLEGLL